MMYGDDRGVRADQGAERAGLVVPVGSSRRGSIDAEDQQGHDRGLAARVDLSAGNRRTAAMLSRDMEGRPAGPGRPSRRPGSRTIEKTTNATNNLHQPGRQPVGPRMAEQRQRGPPSTVLRSGMADGVKADQRDSCPGPPSCPPPHSTPRGHAGATGLNPRPRTCRRRARTRPGVNAPSRPASGDRVPGRVVVHGRGV